MSEQQPHDPQSTPQAPASVDAAARQLASARRRRFIKLGAASVPTALTLASRPVMAWNCNTTSTWGSAQGVSTSHSSYLRSRDSSRLFTDETYTLACWVNNTTRYNLAANPWKQVPISCTTATTTDAAYFKSYTVSQLLAGTGASITGCVGADTVWSILNGSAQRPMKSPANGTFTTGTSICGEFQKLMLVAWLNFKVQNATLSRCLAPGTTNVLVQFGTGSFRAANGQTWAQADIVKYLKKNYVACTDESCA